jgi:hypothetical protein
MQVEPHGRFRSLVDQAMVTGISPDEQRWLDSHINGCAECSRYAELSRRAVGALDSFAFEMDPVAALRVQNAIHSHAQQLASTESIGRTFWIGTVVAMFLTTIGSTAMWLSVTSLATRWSLPTPAWQIGFAAFWFLPSLLLGMLPLFRRKLIGDDSNTGGQRV